MGIENDNQDDDQGPGTEEVEREARNLGWLPQDKFKGPADKWTSAEEFLDKGRHVVPILHQNNKRLQRELLQRDTKIGTLESQLVAAQTAIAGIETRFSQITLQAVKDAKAGLVTKLQQAREDEDLPAELAIQDQLAELRNAETAAAAKKDEPPKKKDEPAQGGLAPEFVAWKEDNPWFGGTSKEDRQRTKEFLRTGEDLRDDGAEETGAAFYALVEETVAKNNRQSGSSKVEGGSSRSSSTKSGKSFADLPADAKQACHEDIPNLVGEGKRYKTQKDWEAAYTRIYNGES